MNGIYRPLSRPEASEYLLSQPGIRRSAGTLAKFAVIGGGPKFKKVKRSVIYDRQDLDVWASGIISKSFANTSEYRRAMRAEKTAHQ